MTNKYNVASEVFFRDEIVKGNKYAEISKNHCSSFKKPKRFFN